VIKGIRDQGFPRLLKSEMTKVAGLEAYWCEAKRDDEKPWSIIQVVWLQNGATYSVVFLSLSKPLNQVKDVKTIIDSLKVTAKK
jgi:hypothetical protein